MSKHVIKLPVILACLIALSAGTAIAVPINDAIIQAVTERYELDSTRYEIEIAANRLKTKIVNVEDLTFRAISKRDPIGPFTIYLQITENGECIDQGQVRLRISKFKEVLVARDNIKRHELLTEDRFELQRMDVTTLRAQPISSLDEIAAMRSKQNVRRGEVLTSKSVEPIPDINSGGMVTIVYTDGLCTVTAPGKALQTGWIGKSIKVRNKTSGKIIQARVKDAQTVAVGS